MILVDVGFGNLINQTEVLGIVRHDSAPVKRLIDNASENYKLINASSGRKVRSAILLKDQYVVLSTISIKTLENRFTRDEALYLKEFGENKTREEKARAIRLEKKFYAKGSQ